MLIQKLLRFQTIPGPYLGEPLPPAPPVPQAFALPGVRPVQPLRLQVRALHLNIQALSHPLPPKLPPSEPVPISPESVRLCRLTLRQLLAHPLEVRQRVAESVAPALETPPAPLPPEAPHEIYLSFLALERPFEKQQTARRRKALSGLPFLDFHFAWEDEAERGEEDSPPR